MRIVGGRHRGRRIAAPEGHNVRPTSDRAREAVFNLLENGRALSEAGFALAGSSVLDAFCGSGALGLEALSRGAGFATFVDVDKVPLAAARDNAESLGETDRCAFLHADIGALTTAHRAHALAFLDPPYRKYLVVPALTRLAEKGWLAEGAVCVVEHGTDETSIAPPASFEQIDLRRYASSSVVFLVFLGSATA